jgi:hypothetical protein
MLNGASSLPIPLEVSILFEEQMKYNIVEKRNTFSRCQGD